MKIVIVGCGRVGSTLAENLDADGHDVIVFDVKTSAFDRLPETFKGAAIRGDGTDEGVLRRSGADGADVFLSLTEGDNRNVMAAQLAQESLGIPRVIAKVNDPVRAAAYAELGLVTLCRTNIMVDIIGRHLGLPMVTGPGIDVPDVGHDHPHPAGRRAAPAPEDETEAEAPSVARPRPSEAESSRPRQDRPAPTPESEAARAQRPGLRRWRGERG
jgi:trk system potassium uptake protein TrkA